MAEKEFTFPSTPQFQERANAELCDLKKKLQKQLKQDINRIYSEGLFPDLEIILNGGRLKTHRSVLKARVPSFYSEITQAKSSTLAKLNHHLIESFIRQVYSHNVVKHKEDVLVSQIKKLSKSKKSDPGSPESDVYITPKDSPLDVPQTYRGGRCTFPKPDAQEPKKSSHYYNLVHLEEEFNSLSSDGSLSNLLERELAEQDQLFESFHSIIVKEEQKKSVPPSSKSIVKPKKSVIVKPVKKLPKKFVVRPLKNEYIDCGFDSEYLNLEGNYKGKETVGMNHGKADDNKEDVLSSGETTGYQESSGYITVGSPLGYSEEIPRDERSGASSPSVTWDSILQDPSVLVTAEEDIPAQVFPEVKKPEEIPSTYSTLPIENGFREPETSTTAQDQEVPTIDLRKEAWSIEVRNKLFDENNISYESKEASSILKTVTPPNSQLTSLISEDTEVLNPPRSQSFHLTNHEEPGRNEDVEIIEPNEKLFHLQKQSSGEPQCSSKPVPCPTNLTFQQSFDCQSFSNASKSETLCSVKTNYFIDASNLLDEDGEVPALSVEYITQSSIDFVEPNEVTKDISTIELNNKSKCSLNGFINESKDEIISSEISPNNNQVNIPPKPLVRNNTFELGSNVNDLSSNSEVNIGEMKPLSDQSKCFNINNFITTSETKKYPIKVKEPKAFMNEEDTPSPDSLNNDNIETNVFEVKMVEHNQNHVLLDLEGTNVIDCNINEVNSSERVNSSPDHNTQGATKTTAVAAEPVCIRDDLGEHSGDINSLHDNGLSMCNDNLSPRKNVHHDIESLPIISGRATIDISCIVDSVGQSPKPSRRKTDSAPILSGAATFSPEIEEKEKPVKTKAVNSMTMSWTIDMSSNSGSELEQGKSEKTKMVSSSFGFFVPLNDMASFKESDESKVPSKCNSDHKMEEEQINSNQGSSCGFYIDLKNDFESMDSQVSAQSNDHECLKPEKKLFPMFIDISDSCSKSSDSTSPKSKTSSPFLPAKKMKNRNNIARCDDPSTSLSSDSGLDMGEHPEVSRGKALFSANAATTTSSSDSSKKQGFFMFIEANDVKINRRKTLPHNLTQSLNRHSWNNDPSDGNETSPPTKLKHDYKRANSISVDQSNYAGTEDCETSGPASIDNSQLQKVGSKISNRMMSSWHGPVKPSSELSRIIKNSKNKESSSIKENCLTRSVSEKGEKEDISLSVKSDDVFDSTASLSSRDDNRTFILDDVSKLAHANTSELEVSTSSHEVISDLSKDDTETDKVQEDVSFCSSKTQKSGNSFETLDENAVSLPKSNSRTKIDSDSFVKLSDMDKRVSPAVKEGKKSCRMTRSIPDGSSFVDNKILTKSSTSRSLSRLFPHLSSSFHFEREELETSISSKQSSLNPSLEVSEEGWSNECSRLGEDLLRMFLEEISPDVVVEVGGRRIKAHKCILSSRCQYFAAMLSGGWVESAGNVISLQGFSYNTVHFALCHIYSGASNVPESINIVELATLADMLCLEGLKEVITYTLKVKYCHFFHKPCSECVVGVVECLPVAAAYGLDEIYRKSLRWISKHYVRVWPTKTFASLPKELHDKCYKQHIVHMNAENILETVMGCEKLEATIPNVRWVQPITSLNTKLQETCHKYLSNHFNEVLSSNSFLSLSREDCWTVSKLEEVLVTMTESLQPDQACLSYGKLHAMAAAITPQTDFKTEFVSLLGRLEVKVEENVVKQAGRVARTPAWNKLDPSLKKKVQDAACLVFAPGDSKRSTILSLQQQRSQAKSDTVKSASAASSLDRNPRSGKQTSRSVGPLTRQPQTKAPGNLVKSTTSTQDRMNRGSSVASSTRSSSTSNSTVRGKTATPPAKSVVKQSQPATPSPLLKSKNNRFSQVKSRYMEPKTIHKEPSDDKLASRGSRPGSSGRGAGSSSESSRTASPAFRHHATMSTDSLEAVAGCPSRRTNTAQPRIAKTLSTRKPARPTARSSTFTTDK